LKRLALAPIFLVGLCVGSWLCAAPWIVGFPAGDHGGWGPATWSSVWAGATILVASGAALVITVGLALAGAKRRDHDAPRG
jgi:hypothetical protein